MIAVGILGALAVIGGGGIWYVFHSAGPGDPCMVSGATVYRECDSDHYCVNPDPTGDGTCMTEAEGKAACASGGLCKAEGKCSFSSGSCTSE